MVFRRLTSLLFFFYIYTYVYIYIYICDGIFRSIFCLHHSVIIRLLRRLKSQAIRPFFFNILFMRASEKVVLFNSLFMLRSKKTSALLVLCEGNPLMTGWQRASNAERFFHVTTSSCMGPLLLTWVNFNPSIDKYMKPLQNVGWNYQSIPKRLYRLWLGMDK